MPSRTVRQSEDLTTPVAFDAGVLECQLKVLQPGLDTPPIDKVHADHGVNAGKGLAVLGHVKRLAQVLSCRRPSSNLALEKPEFAQSGCGDLAVAPLAGEICCLPQVDRALVRITTGEVHEG